MQEGKRQIFSLFFRIFCAKNRRNILVDDTTKRCYTLGNKTTLCNAKERGVSMDEMKEAVGNWRLFSTILKNIQTEYKLCPNR